MPWRHDGFGPYRKIASRIVTSRLHVSKLVAIKVEYEEPDGRRQIALLALGIDRGDQFRQGSVSPASDFFEPLPECIFETNARFVASDYDRALFHDGHPTCCSKFVTSN